MNVTTALILILGFVLAYIFIIEIFTTAFRATGLTREKAKYQSVSLFTNCGFTTTESELITNNKHRRKLATILMIIGHVFAVLIVSLVVAIFGTIKFNEVKKNYIMILIILGVFLFIILLFKLPFIAKPIQNKLDKIATKRELKREKNNIVTVLDSYGRLSLVEIYLYWIPTFLNDKSLKDANIKRDYNLNLVTIKRRNKILDVTAETIIQPLDKIVIFGPLDIINHLFRNKDDKKINEIVPDKNKITIIDNYLLDAMCEIEIHNVPEFMDEKTLLECNLRDKYNISLMMVKRDNKVIMASKNTIIKKLDTIIVFGPYQTIKDVFRGDENK